MLVSVVSILSHFTHINVILVYSLSKSLVGWRLFNLESIVAAIVLWYMLVSECAVK